MSDEHQNQSHSTPPISTLWFYASPSLKLVVESSSSDGGNDDVDAFGLEYDDEMMTFQ